MLQTAKPAPIIEDDVPVPPRPGGDTDTVRQLRVGQSAFFAGRNPKTIRTVASHLSGGASGRKYTCRKATVDGLAGIRVWRIA